MKNIKFAASIALGTAVGTAIYQHLAHSEITVDVYKPVFVGVFTFVITAIWLSIMPKKK